MCRLTLICGLTLGLAMPSVAAPHRLRVHPHPSITILSIAQGPDGFLWLATEDGLYRFDGLHYHRIPDYPFESARFVAFTRDGALWVAGREGLARFKDRFEEILTEPVYGMAALPDRVFISVDTLASVRLDGTVERLNRTARPDLTVDHANRLWFVCKSGHHACSIDPGQPDAEPEKLPETFYQAVRDSRGELWAADRGRAVALRDGKEARAQERRPSNKTERQGPLVSGRNGHLWFLGETIRSLANGVDFIDRQIYERFQPTAGYEDTRGHFWVARLGQGLVEWIPDPAWQRWFPENFGQEEPVQVVRTSQGTHVAATHGNLYRESSTGAWTPVPGESRRYAALFPLEDGGFLASIRRFGLARLSPDGQVVERPSNPLPSVDEYRQILQDAKKRLWVGNKLALLRLEGRPGSMHLEVEKLPEKGGPRHPNYIDHAVDLSLDAAGRIWVGYQDGIAWLDDEDRWRRLATDPPLDTVRSLALHDPLAGENTAADIWVAYRRSGPFSRLQRKGERWSVTDFAANAGYDPVDTHFLKRDSRGWIWRGSPKGVHVSDGSRVAPQDWIHIQLGNGLATESTDQYGFLEDSDGTVWISGEEGVSHFKPDASWFNAPREAPPPRITRLEAGERVYLSPAIPGELPAKTTVLRIEVGSLDTPPFRDHPFRYRLKPLFDDWRFSSDGVLEFRQLPNNSYTLEVAYNGNGPSATLTHPLRIGAAGESLSWRWLIGIPLACVAAALMVRRSRRFRRINYWMSKAAFKTRRRFSHWGEDPPEAAADHSGQVLFGRYRLVAPVSRSGFSVVYEARDTQDADARVALKVLQTKAGHESWVRDHFAQEVAALRSIRHPGVVPILDSWISPAGEPCLAMPFLEGVTLREALESGRFTPPRVARLARQLGDILAEVHHRGIVHRDLKPDNLILLHADTDGEQAVLIDFGTAGLRGEEHELATTTLLAGSFRYMAPERLTGHYSASSDVYAFGIIILEALTGKGLADLRAIYSDAAFRGELERVVRTAVGKGAAEALAEHLHLAYHPEPRQRPTDVVAWAESIAVVLDDE